MRTINQYILNSLLNAKANLSHEAVDAIIGFVDSQKHTEGGFKDRSGSADPYYTVFGLTLCYIFDVEIDHSKEYSFLDKWELNNHVDFVHAISLLRCHYLLKVIKLKQSYNKLHKMASSSIFIQNFAGFQIARSLRKKHKNLLLIVTSYKTKNEGFNQEKTNADHASVYANFLAYGLFEDLHFAREWRKMICASCLSMKLDNGSFVNHPRSKEGISSTTAAGLLLMHQEKLAFAKTEQWLKGIIDKSGGFLAGEQVPIADVLSTATSLLALKVTSENIDTITENAVNFVNLHWDESGGFFGSIADQIPDVEYTFYGLLAVGCN